MPAQKKTYMREPEYFFVREKRGYQKILTSSVVYLEARRNYVKIATTSGDHVIYATLTRFIGLLEGERFRKIHRSFLINLDHLSFFDRKLVHLTGKCLPIGDVYYEPLKKAVIAIGTRQDGPSTAAAGGSCGARRVDAICGNDAPCRVDVTCRSNATCGSDAPCRNDVTCRSDDGIRNVPMEIMPLKCSYE